MQSFAHTFRWDGGQWPEKVYAGYQQTQSLSVCLDAPGNLRPDVNGGKVVQKRDRKKKFRQKDSVDQHNLYHGINECGKRETGQNLVHIRFKALYIYLTFTHFQTNWYTHERLLPYKVRYISKRFCVFPKDTSIWRKLELHSNTLYQLGLRLPVEVDFNYTMHPPCAESGQNTYSQGMI